MAAPRGNKNAVKGKEWTQAIRKAMAHYYPDAPGATKAMQKLAQKLLEAADKGDMWALKEIGDRFEGKPGQSVTLSGDEDNPINTQWTIEIVHKNLPTDTD